MQKTSEKQSAAEKNVILKNKWFHLTFLYIFNTYVHFGQIKYFFKDLKNNFTIPYFFSTYNAAWEPWSNHLKNTFDLLKADVRTFYEPNLKTSIQNPDCALDAQLISPLLPKNTHRC